MSVYFPGPSGGKNNRGSHLGGQGQTTVGVLGSRYPNESGSFPNSKTVSANEMGQKLYPHAETTVIGKPLFARKGTTDPLSYTPP
jgi:hypothetical protein